MACSTPDLRFCSPTCSLSTSRTSFLPRSPGALMFKAASPPLSALIRLPVPSQHGSRLSPSSSRLPSCRSTSGQSRCSPGSPLGSSATSGLHSPFWSSLWHLRLGLPCALGVGPNASDFAAVVTLSAMPANSTPEEPVAILYVVALNCVQDFEFEIF